MNLITNAEDEQQLGELCAHFARQAIRTGKPLEVQFTVYKKARLNRTGAKLVADMRVTFHVEQLSAAD